MWKLFCAIQILLVIISLKLALSENFVPVQNIVDYVTHNLSVYKVNLIVDCCEKLSPQAASIVQEIAHQIPSYKVDQRELVEGYEKKFTSLEGYQKLIFERLSLSIGIIDVRDTIDVHEELLDSISSYSRFVGGYHGKYLLLLISNQRCNLESVFRYAWSLNILDFTTIEISGRYLIETPYFHSLIYNGSAIAIHTFNPFFDDYRVNGLTDDTVLFPNKLQDMNGSKLRGAAYILNFHSFGTKNSFELNSGQDFLLSQALIESLNATMVVLLYTNEGKPLNINSFDSSGPQEDISELIDFWITLDDQPIVSLEKPQNISELIQNTLWVTLPIPNSYHLLVKRPYEESETGLLSLKAVLAYTSLLFTGVFFATYARIFGFKQKNWTALNITTAQMGGSIKHHGRMKISEKVYLILMYIITFMVTDLASGDMQHIYIPLTSKSHLSQNSGGASQFQFTDEDRPIRFRLFVKQES
ncbi:hypothetical protein QAD02_016743 [Eretmocerus hayati]|uniref:Uncharacterized protein n=1 Tax=Eretmocerus hayati TaxID=131215 RepID=A0ACC2PD73_9HYME|nr:hypothetical protein QAD02_016743 [Eretmocerus hayati]